MDDIKYLQKVLRNWREFCRTHKNIERAIKNLIAENEMLKTQVKRNEEIINDLSSRS